VLSFNNAIKLVAERGRLMQDAVPAGEGAMAAILGLEDDDVQAVCKQAAEGEVVEAVNFNTQEQVVIAGHSGAVARAIEQAVAVGAKRALLLPVSVPSHSSLMIGAAEKLYERMSMMTFHPPKIPVLHNIDATGRDEPGAIMEALKLQLHSPVLWVDIINAMVDEGVEAVFELGPGKVLAGLCRRIDKALQVVAVDSPAGLQKAMAMLKGETA
jgi:[acyl-carrier-protein] S-malonyltransferase